jgi:hypothetical protein
VSTATDNGHQAGLRIAVDVPENPLHRLTPAQIEQIGQELDALHEQVRADLG